MPDPQLRGSGQHRIDRHAHQMPDRPALAFRGEAITWTQLRGPVRTAGVP